jgi:Fe-S oxidoreductase
MTKIKSEYLQHWYDNNGTPFNIWAMSYLPIWEKLGSIAPVIYNYLVCRSFASKIIKKIMKFAPERSLPLLNQSTLRREYSKLIHRVSLQKINFQKDKYIYLLADEFTNYQDSFIGKKFINLLFALGYEVRLAPVTNCGRILFSKGLVKRAKRLANKNITLIEHLIDENHPLVGIEPSAILSFRDEYPLLVNRDISFITENCLCFDEFIYLEMQKGNISTENFTTESKQIIYHTHCQQKAIVGEKYMQAILSLPKNYHPNAIPSGCCGMAGSFGYEKKHYKQSEEIVHQVIKPYIDNADEDTIICASGTSCREQILHFTSRIAKHPVEILYEALI